MLHREDGRILHRFQPKEQHPTLGNGGEDRLSSELGMAVSRFRAESASARGVSEFYTLEPGLFLLVTNLERDARLGWVQAGEDLLEFHYRLRGNLHLSGSFGDIKVGEHSMLFWYLPSDHENVHQRIEDGDRPSDVSVTLYCTREWLRSVFSAQLGTLAPVLSGIIDGDAAREDIAYRVLPFSSEMPPLLDALVRNIVPGNIGLIQAKAKALDLLSLSLRLLGRASTEALPARLRFTDREIANITEAKRILSEEYAAPPKLARLARRVGLSAAKLPCGFRLFHGETIAHFVRRVRMEEAHRLLATTDRHIGEVAADVGYGHHSTFTAAFTEHFGTTPKAIVRSRHVYGKAGR